VVKEVAAYYLYTPAALLLKKELLLLIVHVCQSKTVQMRYILTYSV